jgi:hypothetical protein
MINVAVSLFICALRNRRLRWNAYSLKKLLLSIEHEILDITFPIVFTACSCNSIVEKWRSLKFLWRHKTVLPFHDILLQEGLVKSSENSYNSMSDTSFAYYSK